MAAVYRWSDRSARPGARGADYRLRRVTELALAGIAERGIVVDRAVVDRGHEAGYSAAFDLHYRVGGQAIAPSFVDSRSDRRVQLADLVATAGKQIELPSKQFFPGLGGWLSAFAGPRLLTGGSDDSPHWRFVDP